MSTSVKSRVATPVQAERAMSADLALSSTRPVGWSCRRRSPAEVPRNVLVSSCSANPYSFRSTACGRAQRLPERGREVAQHADFGLPRVQPRSGLSRVRLSHRILIPERTGCPPR